MGIRDGGYVCQQGCLYVCVPVCVCLCVCVSMFVANVDAMLGQGLFPLS